MAGTAVVTGANSGIGLATALRLGRDGYDVWAGSRSEAGLTAIAEAAVAAGLDNVRPLQVDVTDDASVASAFGQVLADGPVAVLVNNAGITGASSVEETPIATWQALYDTNVLGVVRCTQQVLPGMREARSGRIVNISSSSAIVSPPLMAPYATTKMAVEGITESLQAEAAEHGIRVTAIQAGTILTPIWGKNEAPPEDTAYPKARGFLLTILAHQLMNTGVPAETVADAIADVVAADAPPLRRIVGDAETLAAIAAKGGDESVLIHLLDDAEMQARYTDLSGIDYWGLNG